MAYHSPLAVTMLVAVALCSGALTACAMPVHPLDNAPPHDAMLAAIQTARVSEPEKVTAVLRQELRLESAAHIGRLDQEERSEMMTAMRGASVALGDRNKLRLLATEWDREGPVPPVRCAAAGQRVRRVQDGREESATNKQVNRQAEDHAAGASQSSGQTSNGISNDSASPVTCIETVEPI